jgi:hypothetical protein
MAEATETMNKNKRYYALHREECNALRLARYHNNPDVIARKEERERKKAEKDAYQKAEKEKKQIEREKKRQEQIQLALATRKVTKKPDEILDGFLSKISPA